MPESGRFTPDKDFYSAHERSTRIRDLCIHLVRNVDALLFIDRLLDDNAASQAYSNLELVEVALREMGVKEKMHMGRDADFFKSNPVAAAEYLAGNGLVLAAQTMISERESLRQADEELSIVDSSGPVILDMSKTPKGTSDFMVQMGMRNTLVDLFGMTSDEVNS